MCPPPPSPASTCVDDWREEAKDAPQPASHPPPPPLVRSLVDTRAADADKFVGRVVPTKIAGRLAANSNTPKAGAPRNLRGLRA